jgi:hypothetical protein
VTSLRVSHIGASDVMHRQDVGVVDCGNCARLPLEAAEPIRVLGKNLREHFDRDFPPEPRVARPIDDTHGARANRRNNLVGAETRPGGE